MGSLKRFAEADPFLRRVVRRLEPPRVASESDIPFEVVSEEELAAIPSDTHAALLLLRDSCALPNNAKNLTTVFALETQVFSIIHSRTQAQSELEDLIQRGVIRRILTKANLGGPIYVFTTDLCELIKTLPSTITTASRSSFQLTHQERVQVAAAFVDHIIPNYKTEKIAHDELQKLLQEHVPHIPVSKCEAQLHRWGTIFNIDSSTNPPHVKFGIPNMGLFVNMVANGKKELITFFRRRPQREVAEEVVLTTCFLKKSTFGVKFHIQQLLGEELLVRIPTAGGDVLRLTE